MKILVLGNSNIFQKKVYPGISKIKKINIEIATKRRKKINLNVKKIYNSYNSAINQTKAKIVYISLINSKHFYWAQRSLNKNKHVIIDKPFTISKVQTEKLLKIANKKKLFLSEAIAFHKHKRLKKTLSYIDFNKPVKIFSNFHIPKLDKDNFRNFKKFGGGCFNDMSPYASFLIYTFFKKNNYIVNSSKEISKQNIESFKIQAKSKNIQLNSSFKFNASYKNELKIYNNSKQYMLDFAFSPPIDRVLKLEIFNKSNKKKYVEYFNKQNIFYSYFNDIFKIIRQNKYNFFYKEIENIAKITKKIS